MLIRSASYIVEGNLLTVSVSTHVKGQKLAMTTYFGPEVGKVTSEVLIPVSELSDENSVLVIALDALRSLRGSDANDRYMQYGKDLGPMPRCTHSEVGDFVRELHRFLP